MSPLPSWYLSRISQMKLHFSHELFCRAKHPWCEKALRVCLFKTGQNWTCLCVCVLCFNVCQQGRRSFYVVTSESLSVTEAQTCTSEYTVLYLLSNFIVGYTWINGLMSWISWVLWPEVFWLTGMNGLWNWNHARCFPQERNSLQTETEIETGTRFQSKDFFWHWRPHFLEESEIKKKSIHCLSGVGSRRVAGAAA